MSDSDSDERARRFCGLGEDGARLDPAQAVGVTALAVGPPPGRTSGDWADVYVCIRGGGEAPVCVCMCVCV